MAETNPNTNKLLVDSAALSKLAKEQAKIRLSENSQLSGRIDDLVITVDANHASDVSALERKVPMPMTENTIVDSETGESVTTTYINNGQQGDVLVNNGTGNNGLTTSWRTLPEHIVDSVEISETSGTQYLNVSIDGTAASPVAITQPSELPNPSSLTIVMPADPDNGIYPDEPNGDVSTITYDGSTGRTLDLCALVDGVIEVIQAEEEEMDDPGATVVSSVTLTQPQTITSSQDKTQIATLNVTNNGQDTQTPIYITNSQQLQAMTVNLNGALQNVPSYNGSAAAALNLNTSTIQLQASTWVEGDSQSITGLFTQSVTAALTGFTSNTNFMIDLNLSNETVSDASGLEAVQSMLDEYGKIGRVTATTSQGVTAFKFYCYGEAPSVDLSIAVCWWSFSVSQ